MNSILKIDKKKWTPFNERKNTKMTELHLKEKQK